MITIIAIVAGGLFLMGMGAVIGYRLCDRQDKAIFQALINQGQMVVRGDDEWVGMPEAFTSILLRMNKDAEMILPIAIHTYLLDWRPE